MPITLKASRNEKPRFATFENAGITAELFAAAAGTPQWEKLSLGSTFAAARFPDADDFALISASERAVFASQDRNSSAVRAANAAFADRVNERFPMAAVPALAYEDDAPGRVRLGMAMATIIEMIELPALANLPESRVFVGDALRALNARSPFNKTLAGTVFAGLGSYEPKARQATLVAFMTASAPLFVGAHDPDHGALVGSMIAGIGYNAAFHRDPRWAATYLKAAVRLATTADIPSKADAPLNALAICSATSFACQRHAAIAFASAFAFDGP
jgi:hypothetical protein